jgi:DNA helicase-2/ATP-dependent DNA helicase PcrA
MISYTDEQLAILAEVANCAIIARPGSGKTTTVARMIQLRLARIPSHRGVIAISYTNKASDELKNRAVGDGRDKKSCFFGTVDRFSLSEIIFPFGSRVLGVPKGEIEVVKLEELNIKHSLGFNKDVLVNGTTMRHHIPELMRLFSEGVVVLETLSYVSNFVLRNSIACRRYIKARYTDILIDEYQDCAYWEHILFLRMCRLGIRGIAVGDIHQAIFGFAQKSAEFLLELAASESFRTLPLSVNHRSHPSIIHYSTKLIDPHHIPAPVDEPRVYRCLVRGDEGRLGEWLTTRIPILARRYSAGRLNGTAILVRFNETAAIIEAALGVKYKTYLTTPLDMDASASGAVFRKILLWLFDPKTQRRELLDDYLEGGALNVRRSAVENMILLEDTRDVDYQNLADGVDVIAKLGTLLLGRPLSPKSVYRLEAVLRNDAYLQAFIPPETDQVQVLTIFKAKGQEYDIVFHADLYDEVFSDSTADQSLHYVGITRARHAVVLCTSTQRHRYHRLVDSTPSPLIVREDLLLLSERFPRT